MMKLTTKYMVVKVNNMMYVRVVACIHVTERLKNSSKMGKKDWSNRNDLTVPVTAQLIQALGCETYSMWTMCWDSERYVLDSKLCHCLPQWNPNAAGI